MKGFDLTALVVDDEDDIRALITFALESEFNVQVIQAKSGNQAIRMLKENPDVEYVISDYHMAEGTGGTLFKYIRETNPKLPFILASSYSPHELDDFRDQPLAGHVEKPNIVGVIPILQKLVKESGRTPSPIMDEYCRIHVDALSQTGLTSFNLFMKLGEDHYVKVVNEGDNFTGEDLKRFRAKKVSHLYLKRENRKKFVQAAIDRISSAMNTKDSKKGQGFTIAQSTMRLIKNLSDSFGWGEEVQELVKKNVELSVKTLQQHPGLKGVIDRLMVDPENYLASHSSMISFVAGGIAEAMGWESETTQFKLSMAAMLHDITLTDDQLAEHDSLMKMATSFSGIDTDQTFEFKRHPAKAAELARGFEKIPPDVDTLIAQHHERPDGTGFPSGLTHEKISPLAAIFIVAEELVDHLHKNGASKDVIQKFLMDSAERFSQGNFKKIHKALMQSLK